MHTPELSSERGKRNVELDTKEQGLNFPVVIDDAEANWNAWGNSMWPSVYLIDKQGYVRYWWYGELKWKDGNGHKIMRQRVRELISEGGDGSLD